MSYQVTKTPVKTNHILHLLLTLATCGFWAPVWILMAIINANREETTVTQTYGSVPVYQPQGHFNGHLYGPPQLPQSRAGLDHLDGNTVRSALDRH